MTTGKSLDVAEIGRRLVFRREQLGLGQEEVAERAMLSRPYISRLERGIVPNPKLLDLAQVANALDVSLIALVSPDPAGREIRIAEGTDILEQLADEPPDVAETILAWWRQSLEIARANRRTRDN